MTNTTSIADILGPWIDPNWESGLVMRCKAAWNKPLQTLTNEELGTLLQQRFAVEHLLPIAQKRLKDGIDDNSETYDGELKAAVEYIVGST